ncbi:MAG: aminoglycoside phosphotransferase family protein [Chloroflexi bacterium]|nr:aminoglycoside phosphotransferase family protein [Chloroflexota bacterium]MBP8056330.1 aminoglycoside phosphotransferase family protein [Chloroflexota bacterium]
MFIFPPPAQEWLAQAIRTTPPQLKATPLKGSTSSSVYLVQTADQPQQFVLRVLDNPDWLAEEPDLAEHEAAALHEAQKTSVTAPTLVAYASEAVGFGAPVVLMTFLDGQINLQPTNFAGWLDCLAQELALIHQHITPDIPWQFRSWAQKEKLAPPTWTTRPHVWTQAITHLQGPEPDSPTVFIHRDYHPTNVLWQGDKISGVVDWINACRGPAGVDVAHCRTNLVMMFGLAAADQFLASYCRFSPTFTYNPYWDIDGVMDMAFPQPTFYAPWLDFGLKRIPQKTLNQQLDNYINTLMLNLKEP